MRMGECSDVGRYRKLNEDSYFVYKNEQLTGAMVADGMGGHNAGEVASKMAAELVKSAVIDGFDPNMDYVEFSEVVRRAMISANEEIFRKGKFTPGAEGMGTTAAAAFVFKGKLITANVGDSRVYAVGESAIRQITRDHSYVEELVERGEITPEGARLHPQKNYITRALGSEPFVKVDISITEYDGERIVVCTDGLTNLVSDEQIFTIVTENEDFDAAAKQLVQLANQKGGTDNITCVVFCVDEK